MPRILLGVTGGIAAYKALEFARLAVKAGHSLRVIQTEAATRFVGSASFATITGAPVLIHQWDPDPMFGVFPGDEKPDHVPLSHLRLVEEADLFLIAPASANTIAKLAAGISDNLLTVSALACKAPIIIAPAMNNAMYEHPATQENLSILKARGVQILEPTTGSLGSLGEWGIGRLVEPPELLAACESVLASTPNHASTKPSTVTDPSNDNATWTGKRVLVTAGGTREPLDLVRFIGNRSSGRMGFALASEAAERGAEVTVIAANVSLPRANNGIRYINVETAAELDRACSKNFTDCDVLLMAAAVSDFRPAEPIDDKVKKDEIDELTVELEPTNDILLGLSKERRPDQILVGFAAEAGRQGVDNGRKKLQEKSLDAIVVNDIARSDIGFDATENEVTIVTADSEQLVPKTSKEEVASAVLNALHPLLNRS
jgi:phosphopantothenoylcysteine decarboxylase/phosphopantothenate--cysteine ligase